jgi:hypothetical protein
VIELHRDQCLHDDNMVEMNRMMNVRAFATKEETSTSVLRCYGVGESGAK